MPDYFQKFLDLKNIWHEFLIKDDTRGADRASQATGINLDGIVKSLVFKAGNDFCLIIIQASSRVSTKKLRNLMKEENIRLASEDEVLNITGFAVGAVPPIGLENKIKCIIDKNVLTKEKVWAGGGSINRLVHLKVDDIIKYHNPIIEDIGE